jgi:hypothetical protein
VSGVSGGVLIALPVPPPRADLPRNAEAARAQVEAKLWAGAAARGWKVRPMGNRHYHFISPGGYTTTTAKEAREQEALELEWDQGADASDDEATSVRADEDSGGDDSSQWDSDVCTEDGKDDAPLVSKIMGHWVYSHARPGSMFHIYVRAEFDDGSTSGRGYVASEALARSKRGPSPDSNQAVVVCI